MTTQIQNQKINSPDGHFFLDMFSYHFLTHPADLPLPVKEEYC